jgi:hypothetical protein
LHQNRAYSQNEWAFLFPKGSKKSRMIPAIASLEELRVLKKLLRYAMRHALCDLQLSYFSVFGIYSTTQVGDLNFDSMRGLEAES